MQTAVLQRVQVVLQEAQEAEEARKQGGPHKFAQSEAKTIQ